MNTSFDITDIDCAPKELEDALGVSGRTLFDPSEHPIHVDIWDGKAYVTLAEMIELEGDALCHFLAIVFPASPSAGPYVPSPAGESSQLMMTLSARPRTAATNSNLRDDPFAMSPNTTGSHPSASKRTSYASNVLRFLITNMTLFGLGLGCSMTQSGTDTLRSNRLTCLCSESEEFRMASSCSENSERRLSNLSVSVLPLFAALLPVMTQPATDTPIVTTHPAMVTHNPFIDSSPNCSARTSQMRDDTDFRRGPGGSPNAARHHTRKGGA